MFNLQNYVAALVNVVSQVVGDKLGDEAAYNRRVGLLKQYLIASTSATKAALPEPLGSDILLGNHFAATP